MNHLNNLPPLIHFFLFFLFFFLGNGCGGIGQYSEPDCNWSRQLWCTRMAAFSSLPTVHSTRWHILHWILLDDNSVYFSNCVRTLLGCFLLGLQKQSNDPRAFSFLNILELIRDISRPPVMLFVENVVGFEVCSWNFGLILVGFVWLCFDVDIFLWL